MLLSKSNNVSRGTQLAFPWGWENVSNCSVFKSTLASLFCRNINNIFVRVQLDEFLVLCFYIKIGVHIIQRIVIYIEKSLIYQFKIYSEINVLLMYRV